MSDLEYEVLWALSDGSGRPDEIPEGEWKSGVDQCLRKGWLTEDLQLTDQVDQVLTKELSEGYSPNP